MARGENKKGFGLDISDLSLKLVELNRKGNLYLLNSLAEIKLPPATFEDGKIRRKQVLIENIKNLIANAKPRRVNTDNVVCSVPESKVYIHLTKLPKMTEEKIDEAIKWEAEQHIPVPIDNVYLDWEKIGEEEGKYEILIAASPKDTVDSYLELFKEAGLKVLALEIESKAVLRTLYLNSKDYNEAVLLIDLGARMTSFTIFDRGAIKYSSSIPVAGDAITDAISEKLNIPRDKAEEIKIDCGLDETKRAGRIFLIAQAVLGDILKESKNTIDFYTNESDGQQINKIVLTGGSANLKKLRQYFEDNLGIKTERADVAGILAKNFTEKSGALLSSEQALDYETAIGLALRAAQNDPVGGEINLMPQTFQKKYSARKLKSLIKAIGVSILLTILLVFSLSMGTLAYLQVEKNKLQQEIQDRENIKSEELLTLENFAKKFNAQIRALRRIDDKKFAWGQIFSDIKKSVPDGVSLDNIEFSSDNNMCLIKGRTPDRQKLTEIETNLKNLSYLTEVKNPLSNLGRVEDGLIEFEMSFKFITNGEDN